MGLLDGKIALITGASRGIGRAIALKFAQEGADIAFTYLSNKAAADETVAQIQSLGRKVVAYSSDAGSFDKAHELVGAVQAAFGRIDILVNNAGITRDTLLMRMDESQWDAVLNSNLKSAFNFTHAVVPIMARQRCGSIISMSSVVGVAGNAGQCNYAASKAGIIALSTSVAKEMGARNIRANCIAPGFIDTDMTSSLPEELRKEWAKTIPLRRAGKAEEVANVALFLASELSSYVTGQVIHCCGGMSY
ncbi:MAG: 3-oxoacyl-[acyl-carrier-protein] reductase [Candidatus Cryptobacteroides sp.]